MITFHQLIAIYSALQVVYSYWMLEKLFAVLNQHFLGYWIMNIWEQILHAGINIYDFYLFNHLEAWQFGADILKRGGHS